ncbi:MAG: hypothetical protein O7C59_09880, partial [Rickettsia endosymbiont of Ixodes persulcatus]|nr:hypothetical protein [Rickettsia endosymbiont of Ixodes persulcatus]
SHTYKLTTGFSISMNGILFVITLSGFRAIPIKSANVSLSKERVSIRYSKIENPVVSLYVCEYKNGEWPEGEIRKLMCDRIPHNIKHRIISGIDFLFMLPSLRFALRTYFEALMPAGNQLN